MALKSSKYKKVLTKKLSSTVILLVLLVMGVLAVVFNRVYLSPRAGQTIDEKTSGGGKCYNDRQCLKTQTCNQQTGKCVAKSGGNKKNKILPAPTLTPAPPTPEVWVPSNQYVAPSCNGIGAFKKSDQRNLINLTDGCKCQKIYVCQSFKDARNNTVYDYISDGKCYKAVETTSSCQQIHNFPLYK